MPARLSAFLIWALVAATVVFWGLRLIVRSQPAPSHTVAANDSAPGGDLTRLLGAAPVAAPAAVVSPQVASRFRLTGVMAPKPPGTRGFALIAVDGKMPRAFRVGAPVDAELVLQSVSLRSATIGPPKGSPAVVLELPVLPPPATGSLPSIDAGAANPGMPPAPPPVVRPVPPSPSPLPPAPLKNGQRMSLS
jgi:general secretion pathway protein C